MNDRRQMVGIGCDWSGVLLMTLCLAATTGPAQAQKRPAKPVADQITAPCPATGPLAQGDCLQKIDDQKQYVVHVPALYQTKYVAKNRRAPLLLDLVGLEGNPNHQRQTSGQLGKSDELGFVAVWPKPPRPGGQGGWQVGDVDYLKGIIADMKTRYRIDPDRVYVTGHSKGGFMTHQMGCHAGDVVRAIAPTSFPLVGEATCKLAHPIAVTMFHGTADKTVAYGAPFTVGTPNGPVQEPRFRLAGAVDTLNAWGKAIDGCKTANLNHAPVNPGNKGDGSYIQSYSGCGTDRVSGQPVSVRLVTVLGIGHDIYPYQRQKDGAPSPNDIDIASYIWSNVFDGR